jgi:hypothetical protein
MLIFFWLEWSVDTQTPTMQVSAAPGVIERVIMIIF